MAVVNIPDKKQTVTGKDAIKSFLGNRGIYYDTWQASQKLAMDADQQTILKAYEPQLKPFMAEGGYTVADVINVHAGTPNLPAMRAKFLNEHTHTEDEVRFFVNGQGLFWFNHDGEVFSVLCQAGDFISVPKNKPHWFDLGPEAFVKAIRIFIDPSGWVAHYTESGVDKRYNPIYPS